MSLTVSRSSPVRFPATWASVYFDLLRGLAAFFVLFHTGAFSFLSTLHGLDPIAYSLPPSTYRRAWPINP